MHLRLCFTLPAFLIVSIFGCDKVKSSTTTLIEYKNPVIHKVSLYDTLPAKSLALLSIKEINGIKAIYATGNCTSYFEYEADPNKVLTMINSLPFRIDNNEVIDTTYHEMNSSFSLSGRFALSSEEVMAASYFWQIHPDGYMYYECLKGSVRHTLLISKISQRILHRIESGL